jgi:4a-hydroxytetrahydrobiopterin dehydratase
MTEPISWRTFRESAGTEDWRNLSDSACALCRTGSFAASARFVAAICELPGVEDHQPAIDIRQDGVTVQLVTVTEAYDGMSRQDVELARQISALAKEHGLVADPSAVQSLLIIPGTPAGIEVGPFWQAMLGYDVRPGSPAGDLADPRRRGPSLWVERMREPRADGGGSIHVAIWVPYEQAEARVAAALAAGGRLVRDHGPAWWTLADAAGNEADIGTTMGRD